MTEIVAGMGSLEKTIKRSASPEEAERAAIRELVVAARARGEDLTGPDGLLKTLTKTVLETALEEEISEHLGYDKHAVEGRNGANSRNGKRAKTVVTDAVGPVQIEVPRDRDGTFDPVIVRKRQRRLTDVDTVVLSLSAKGLTTGEIRCPLRRGLRRVGEQGHRLADHRRTPKLMAHVRDSARTYGKSDPIDALAVARAALREPGLPTARLDGPEREVRLLVDHREDLLAERTRVIGRLRWHLHELDPTWAPAARALDRGSAYDAVDAHLDALPDGGLLVARLARSLVQHLRALTVEIDQLHTEIEARVHQLVPTLLAIVGVGPLTAAKILGETAGVDRFASKDSYARYSGTAPLPVWSSNRARHRLSRTGNRQLNAALHRMALTQMRVHPPAKAMIERRRAGGDGGMEALRILKRRLSDVAYKALRDDLANRAELTAA